MSLRYPTTDSELKTIVRAETSYEDSPDELPDSQLTTIIERAKAKVEMKTGSAQWYSDNGLGFALAAYTCMRAKSAVENVPLSGYTFGAESVSFSEEAPEDSFQLQQWAQDVQDGLDASEVDQDTGPTPANTSGYIGESYVKERRDRR